MQTNLPKKAASFGHIDPQVTFSSDRMEPNGKQCD